MNSPYTGKFRVSQPYKGDTHDGLDLVGIDNKEIRSTIDGTVLYAGWENAANRKQGFGLYAKICKAGTDEVYFFGHLSSTSVRTGDKVQQGQLIGVEGTTGRSTGSHLHYCMRMGGRKGLHRDISTMSGIPNAKGTYSPCGSNAYAIPTYNVKIGCRGKAACWVQEQLQRHGYDIGRCGVDGIIGNDTVQAILHFQAQHGLVVDGIVGKKTREKLLGMAL